MVAIVSWLNSGSLRLTRRSWSMTARYPHRYDRGDHATSAGRLDGAAAPHIGRQPGRAPAGVAAPSRPSGAARGGLWSPRLRSQPDRGDLRHSRRSRPGGPLRDWRSQGCTAGKSHAPGSARIAAAPGYPCWTRPHSSSCSSSPSTWPRKRWRQHRRVFRARTARKSACEPARGLSAVLTAGVDWRPPGPHSLRASNFTPWVGGLGGGQ